MSGKEKGVEAAIKSLENKISKLIEEVCSNRTSHTGGGGGSHAQNNPDDTRWEAVDGK